MAYHREGSYQGRENLAKLADLVGSFDMTWDGAQYATTTDQRDAVREIYHPHLPDVFPGTWRTSMLVVVQPGGSIPPHVDLRPEAGLERYHLVLQTNPQSWSMHGGEWTQLELGGIYTLDPTVLHAAVNWGQLPRIHLVADVPVAMPLSSAEMAAAGW